MTKTTKHGGSRQTYTDEEKVAKVRRVKRLIELGYNNEIACRRAVTTIENVRRWAREYGIRFSY